MALESAVGGMLLSAVGMGVAAAGMLSPVAGAVAQEVIDLVAVLNALRTARQPSPLTDFQGPPLAGAAGIPSVVDDQSDSRTQRR